MHKFTPGWMLLILTLAVLTGCRQPATTPAAAGIAIQLTVAPDPPVTGEAALTIRVTEHNQPIAGGKVTVRGDMSHAGMVPVLREGVILEQGEITVPFEWTMAGDWFVEVTVTLPDGRTAQKRFDYFVASSSE